MKNKQQFSLFILNTQSQLLILAILITCLTYAAQAQFDISEVKGNSKPGLNRERGLSMLKQIKDVIKERYYDQHFHGINLDERFKIAAERIKTQELNSQIFRTIAQVLIDFDDSHTRFYPPNRANRVEYGFTMQMIGDTCFVVDVKKGSDAEAKGLKIGDEIAAVSKFVPTRDNLWRMQYVLYSLDPQENIKLFVRNPDKSEREISFKSKIITFEERQKERDKRRNEELEKPYKCQEISSELIACKLYTFSVDKNVVDKMMKEVRPHKKMILDLRSNRGGYIKTELYLTGYFFDHDIKVGDEKSRDNTKERIAKTLKDKAYKGDLIVLIDSQSASASEVFSRVMQIENRGKIIGDQSAGAVMTSNFISMSNVRGIATYSFFAINLTVGDLIMSDGKRLEKIGVIPDVPIGPSAYALSTKSDPILGYAAGLFGSQITAEKAGEFYFLTKKPEDDADKEKDEDSDTEK